MNIMTSSWLERIGVSLGNALLKLLARVPEISESGDSRRSPYYLLDVDFTTLADLRSEDCARAFFSLLATHDDRFMPTQWDDDNPRPVSLDLDNLDGPIAQWASTEPLELHSRRRQGESDLDWFIMTHGRDERLPVVSLSITEKRVGQTGPDLDRLLNLALDMYGFSAPVYGHIRKRPPPTSSFFPPISHSIPGVFWVNFFGAPYVEMLGADKLRTAPCCSVRELDYGGFMLMLAPTPDEANSRKGRKMAEAVKDHLGREYFYDRSDGDSYAKLKRRTVPAFDRSRTPMEDVEPLTFASLQEIYDVPDAQQFINDVPMLVEALRERLARDVDPLDFSESSLRLLDRYLKHKWSHAAPDEDWRSPELIRELTAYTGEVVRRILRGEWVAEQLKEGGHAPLVRGEKTREKPFDPLLIVAKVVVENLEDEEGCLLAPAVEAWLSGCRSWPEIKLWWAMEIEEKRQTP